MYCIGFCFVWSFVTILFVVYTQADFIIINQAVEPAH